MSIGGVDTYKAGCIHELVRAKHTLRWLLERRHLQCIDIWHECGRDIVMERWSCSPRPRVVDSSLVVSCSHMIHSRSRSSFKGWSGCKRDHECDDDEEEI
jgi:hypothetical protein